MFVPFYAYFSLTLTYFFMRKQSFPTSLEFFKFKALYNYSPELPLFSDLRYRSYKIFRKICEKNETKKPGICCKFWQQMPGFDMRPAGASAILFLFCTEVLHYFPCDNQSNYRWHKCHTSRNISSLRTFMLCSWRTDTMVSAADCHVLDWSGRFLFWINNFQLLNMTLL